MSNNPIIQVKELKKKAEQNRQMHFSICKKANWINKSLHALVLVGSSATAVLTFAEYKTFLPWISNLTDGEYKLIIGVFAGLVFIITILEEYFRFGEKAASHETIGKQLTSFIRKASILETYEVISEDDIDKLTNEYNYIHENAPVIPDRTFLKEKQRLRIKIDISKKLEITPHMSIPFYKWKMKITQFCGQGNRSEDDGSEGQR
ncbi:SLATT domain-containing protein [Brevibacillus centrosporus]|uniref:SLATT domain-containing protein n=1 Tax=Brevibacillus centrosporus TaxID=54910 RepID=UPI002E1E7B76|nr:SLATT domain-containing protein [Brevibacillus centrosporus]